MFVVVGDDCGDVNGRAEGLGWRRRLGGSPEGPGRRRSTGSCVIEGSDPQVVAVRVHGGGRSMSTRLGGVPLGG